METFRETNARAGDARPLVQRPRLKRLTGARARSSLAFLGLLMAVVLFGASAGKPLQLDNMDFAAAAKATAETGLPVYYRGEGASQHLGLYHPPLYIYLLAAWIKMFGLGEVQVRMFGFLCALLQGWIVLCIGRTLLGRAAARQAAPWFWVLFLLNPYTLQTAAIADIDSTIYGPLLCAIVLVTLRMSWCEGAWREGRVRLGEYICLAMLIALTLWAKLTTVLLVFPFMFLALLSRLGIGGALRATTTVSLLGAGTFLATYYAYGLITGLDISYSFRFTLESLLRHGWSGSGGLPALLGHYWRTFIVMAPLHCLWTGLLPWLAGLAAAAAALRHAIQCRSRRAWHIALVLLLALGATGYYCAQTLTFGAAPFKYVFVCWAIVVACPVFLASEALRRASSNGRRSGGAAWLAVVCVIYLLGFVIAAAWVKDTMILDGLIRRPYSWSLYLPAVLTITAAALSPRWRKASAWLFAWSLAAWGGLSFGVALAQSRASYSTTYDYGQSGFEDTVGYLRAVTTSDQVIASMKDIGFKAGRRYYENYAAVYGGAGEASRLIEVMASGKVRYAVFTEGRGQDQLIMNPLLKSWMEEHCAVARSFGHYRVYDCAKSSGGAARP